MAALAPVLVKAERETQPGKVREQEESLEHPPAIPGNRRAAKSKSCPLPALAPVERARKPGGERAVGWGHRAKAAHTHGRQRKTSALLARQPDKTDADRMRSRHCPSVTLTGGPDAMRRLCQFYAGCRKTDATCPA